MYHSCLHEILRELRDLQDDDASTGHGTRMTVVGMGEVHLHFELAVVIGDTLAHDMVCGRYKSYGNMIS